MANSNESAASRSARRLAALRAGLVRETDGKQFSLEDLAHDIPAVTSGTIRRWEDEGVGGAQLADKVGGVANYFRVTIDYLLGRDIDESIAVLEERIDQLRAQAAEEARNLAEEFPRPPSENDEQAAKRRRRNRS